MRKTNLRFAYVTLLLLAAAFLLSLDSCKKADLRSTVKSVPVEKFFSIPPNTPAIVMKVADALKRQNAIGDFIPSLVKESGYALWDKSFIERPVVISAFSRSGEFEQADTLVYTPIVQQDSNFVSGFLLSRVMGDSVELHLYRDNDYDHFSYGNVNSDTLTAERVALQLMVLNNTIFGHTKFILTDTLLFRNNYRPQPLATDKVEVSINTEDNSSFTGTFSNRFHVSTITVCVTYQVQCSSKGVESTTESAAAFFPWVCHNTICETISIYGDDGDWPSDPTGGGGSGGGGSSPPNNCTGNNNCGRLPTIIEGGRLPCGNCGSGPIIIVPIEEPEPFPSTDSLLAKLSRAIKSKADSLFNLSSQQNHNEWGMIVVRKNGVIYGKNEKTDNDPGYVKFNWFLASGEELLGDFHVHNDPDSLGRSSFSDADLEALRRNKDKYQYTKFVECGNIRYAIVVEDVGKANNFFSTHSKNAIRDAIVSQAYSHPQAYSNWQTATESVFANYLGSSATSGIGFYKSSNNDKTTYIKLN